MATPVVRPWYDPHFDMGTPAIVGYWAAFLGERQRMFDATMKSRLSKMDTSALDEEIAGLNEQIARMQRERSGMKREGLEAFGGIWKATVSAEGSRRAAEMRAQGNIAVERIKQGVKLEELTQEQRLALQDMDQLSGESMRELAQMQAEVAAAPDPKAARTIMNATYEKIRNQEGVVGGGAKDDAIKKNIGIFLAGAGDSGRSVIGQIEDPWYQGKKPVEWYESKHGPSSPEALEQRRQQTLGFGVSAEGSSLFNLFGTPGAPGFVPSGEMGTGGGTGAPSGPGGAGGGGAAARQTPSSFVGQSAAEYMRILDPEVAAIDRTISDLEAQRNRAVAEREAARSRGIGDIYQGYGFNYLLETQFTGRPTRGRKLRVQEGVDALAAADPRVREEAMTAIQRAGGNVRKADLDMFREAQVGRGGDPVAIPRPGTYLQQAGGGDEAPGIFEWMFDELQGVANALPAEGGLEPAVRRLASLQETNANLRRLDPTMYAASPRAFDEVDRAVTLLEQGIGRTPRQAIDPNGTFAYLQGADGSIRYVELDPSTGTAKADKWTVAKSDQAGAIEKVFEAQTGLAKHPTTLDRDELLGEVYGAVDQASLDANAMARAGDRYFSEALSDAIEEARQSDDKTAAVQRIDELGKIAWEGLPRELTGTYGEAAATAIKGNIKGNQLGALWADTKTLIDRGRDLGEQRRNRMTPEERAALRDRIEADRPGQPPTTRTQAPVVTERVGTGRLARTLVDETAQDSRVTPVPHVEGPGTTQPPGWSVRRTATTPTETRAPVSVTTPEDIEFKPQVPVIESQAPERAATPDEVYNRLKVLDEELDTQNRAIKAIKSGIEAAEAAGLRVDQIASMQRELARETSKRDALQKLYGDESYRSGELNPFAPDVMYEAATPAPEPDETRRGLLRRILPGNK